MTLHRLHAKEVALPLLTFQFGPHCGQCDICLGGELAKEVTFTLLISLVLLSKAHCVYLMACFLFHFVKLLVCFCKAENIVIFSYIYDTTYFLS